MYVDDASCSASSSRKKESYQINELKSLVHDLFENSSDHSDNENFDSLEEASDHLRLKMEISAEKNKID